MPDRLHRFELVRQAGEGTDIVVWEVKDPERPDKHFALKWMPAIHEEQLEIERRGCGLQREAFAASQAVVEVIEDGLVGEDYYILMELVQGVSLHQELKNSVGRRLPPKRAVDIVAQLCLILSKFHDRVFQFGTTKHGIAHGDLKPQNLLLQRRAQSFSEDEGDVLRLSDFGSAVAFDGPGERTKPVAFTAQYQSIESVNELLISQKSDIWAVGVILHQLLSGRFPFGGSTKSEIEASIRTAKPKPPLPTTFHRELINLVLSCLERDDDRRPSASKVVERLSQLDENDLESSRHSSDESDIYRTERVQRRQPDTISESDEEFGGREESVDGEPHFGTEPKSRPKQRSRPKSSPRKAKEPKLAGSKSGKGVARLSMLLLLVLAVAGSAVGASYLISDARAQEVQDAFLFDAHPHPDDLFRKLRSAQRMDFLGLSETLKAASEQVRDRALAVADSTVGAYVRNGAAVSERNWEAAIRYFGYAEELGAQPHDIEPKRAYCEGHAARITAKSFYKRDRQSDGDSWMERSVASFEAAARAPKPWTAAHLGIMRIYAWTGSDVVDFDRFIAEAREANDNGHRFADHDLAVLADGYRKHATSLFEGMESAPLPQRMQLISSAKTWAEAARDIYQRCQYRDCEQNFRETEELLQQIRDAR